MKIKKKRESERKKEERTEGRKEGKEKKRKEKEERKKKNSAYPDFDQLRGCLRIKIKFEI